MQNRQNISRVTLDVKLRRSVWNVVSLFLFRPFGTKVFRLWRIFLLKLFGAQVDWHSEVYSSARIWAPWMLSVGKGACIGPHAIIYNQAWVTLMENVCLSQYTYVCTAGHALDTLNNSQTGLIVAPVVFHPSCWIGTRAFIGMGVEIGERAVVGACACVFKDVPPLMVVGGNPAVILKSVEQKA